MKFKNLLKIAIGIFTFCVIGIYFVFGPMHTEYFQWQPHHGQDFAKVHPDLEQVKGEGTEGLDLAKAIVATPESIAKGKTLFQGKCVMCHGAKGNGKGPAAGALKPRNFTQLVGWTNGPELSNIFKTLTEGIGAKGMPGFGTLPAEERIALAHYVQTFASYPKPGESDIAKMDEMYSLSAGSKEPNIIPVVRAISKLDAEFTAAHPNFHKMKKVEPVVVDIPEEGSQGASESEVSTEESTSAELTPAQFEALKAEGQKLYQSKCVSCHQANGKGMPGAFPPLAQSDYLAKATIKRFTRQVSMGSKDGKGGLVVNGVKYSVPMPAQTQNPKELTALANYVLNSWGNSYGPVKQSEVEENLK